jgi:hypothetical protein
MLWMLLLFTLPLCPQTPVWEWARGISNSTTGNPSAGFDIVANPNGGVFVTGFYCDTPAIFGTKSLSSVGGADMMLLQYDSLGNVGLAVSAGNYHAEAGHTISRDTEGNLYVAGQFLSPVLIIGQDTLVNQSAVVAATYDVFIAKFDSAGNSLWAKSFGGTLDEAAIQMITDHDNNLYITGYWNSPTLVIGNDTLINPTQYMSRYILIKYSPIGALLWYKTAYSSLQAQGTSLTIDEAGSVYVTGVFGGQIFNIGNFTLYNVNQTIQPYYTPNDIFIIKYDTFGNVIWARSDGGKDDDVVTSIIKNNKGELYITGAFSAPWATFGNDTVFSLGNQDFFLAKYSDAGLFLGVVSGGGIYSDVGMGVVCAENDHVIIAGVYSSPQFAIGTKSIYNQSNQSSIFILKYDGISDLKWLISLGGSSLDEVRALAIDKNRSIYITGFSYSPFLRFGTDTLWNSTGGQRTYYLAKLTETIGLEKQPLSQADVSVFPSPFKDKLAIQINESVLHTSFQFELFEITGRRVFATDISENTSLSLDMLTAGLYFWQLTNHAQRFSGKILKGF